MNKKLVFSFVFIVSAVYSQSIDFNKINGGQAVEKPLFANIETNMKNMEDNILKLMRELGELKMQMQELKANVKNKLGSQQEVFVQGKPEPVAESKPAAVAPVDKVVTGTALSIDNVVTASNNVESKPNLPFNDISADGVVQPLITTSTSGN